MYLYYIYKYINIRISNYFCEYLFLETLLISVAGYVVNHLYILIHIYIFYIVNNINVIIGYC